MDKTPDSSASTDSSGTDASSESSDPSCSSIASYLAEHYGLAEPVEVRELERGANRNYLVTSQAQRYVHRIYTDHDFYVRNPEAYRYELDLLAYLREYDLPVPEPVTRRDGQRLSIADPSSYPRTGPSSGPLTVPICSALFHFFEGEEHVTWHPEVNDRS